MTNEHDPSAEPYVPDELDYDVLFDAAVGCKGCPLYKDASHVVFGEGPLDARLMLVGESPGSNEDKEGRPFVGSAGDLLDQALAEVGLSRHEIYITNAVKHIRWSPQNGTRTPKTPTVTHIKACRPWLDAEVELVQPMRIVALGTRAARSVLGEEVSISEAREILHQSVWGIDTVVTYHPSAALRHPVPEERERIFRALVEDLFFAQRPPHRPKPRPHLF